MMTYTNQILSKEFTRGNIKTKRSSLRQKGRELSKYKNRRNPFILAIMSISSFMVFSRMVDRRRRISSTCLIKVGQTMCVTDKRKCVICANFSMKKAILHQQLFSQHNQGNHISSNAMQELNISVLSPSLLFPQQQITYSFIITNPFVL